MAFQELLPIAIEICRGFTAAHNAQIIHRDLKPDNIFIEALPGNKRRVKLVDFGIAAMLDEERKEDQKQRIGTLRYMAPEQCQGRSIDARADLYALGVILYEGLTRRRATGKSVKMSREVPAVPNTCWQTKTITPGLEDVVVRLLAKKANDRPQSAKALADFFQTLLNDPSRKIEATTFDDVPDIVLPSPRLLLSFTGLVAVIAGILVGVTSWLIG